jgi:hypothetical protein
MICTNAERESNPVLRALNPMKLYIRKSRLCLHKIDRGFTFSTIWLISLCYNKSASTLQM